MWSKHRTVTVYRVVLFISDRKMSWGNFKYWYQSHVFTSVGKVCFLYYLIFKYLKFAPFFIANFVGEMSKRFALCFANHPWQIAPRCLRMYLGTVNWVDIFVNVSTSKDSISWYYVEFISNCKLRKTHHFSNETMKCMQK